MIQNQSPSPAGPDLRAELSSIMALAHVNTFHPNAFDWTQASTPGARDFLSTVVWEQPGHEREAIAYITKELAQLAEIERHVSAVMALILSEVSRWPALGALAHGHELHHALSCFGAEEMQHANTFYRYVREISGLDPVLPDGLFTERLRVFQGDDHPWVKLIALCCSAYVGESVITVFERRTDGLDPGRRQFLTRLLHTHGLDEARHVRVDHLVMLELFPSLGADDRRRVGDLVKEIDDLNRRLAGAFTVLIGELLGVDVTLSPAYQTQLALTVGFGNRLFDDDGMPRTADDLLDDPLRKMLTDFTGAGHVHPPTAGSRIHPIGVL
jgi:hypothetical protein